MANYNIVTHETSFPIKPSMIDTRKGGHFWNAFGHSETEISARYIVRLCQYKGDWYPFSHEDIEAFYNESGHKNFSFNRLIEPGIAFYIQKGNVPEGGGWIIEKDGLCHVTDDFVWRCYNAAPARTT